MEFGIELKESVASKHFGSGIQNTPLQNPV